nr:hypothetical protein [Nocardia wallacei]
MDVAGEQRVAEPGGAGELRDGEVSVAGERRALEGDGAGERRVDEHGVAGEHCIIESNVTGESRLVEIDVFEVSGAEVEVACRPTVSAVGRRWSAMTRRMVARTSRSL